MRDETTMTKWVYAFGDGKAEGVGDDKALLGGKGAGLAEMSRLGLPVPPGFTITTACCTEYVKAGGYPSGLEVEVAAALKMVEATVGAKFGNTSKPLLVSVRSGARNSMTGMMDTVLNIGLNDTTVEGLASLSGDARFAYDSYRRFIQMYGDVVMGIEHYHFEDILEDYKHAHSLTLDTDLAAKDWKAVVAAYKEMVEGEKGKPFPQEPPAQLWGAIGAVFRSWNNQRAVTYRRLHNIPEDWGTAVNVQAMVFGNMGETSATGVCFTRNPSTGVNAFYGEFLVNAQGEDVVAGIRTPQPLTRAEAEAAGGVQKSMEEVLPQAFADLVKVRNNLEKHFSDMQDMEFTVQQGKLWMLQTRNGKRTTQAALKIAVDMVSEGLIDKKTAVKRIDPASLDQLLHPTLDPKAERKVLGTGLPASPGAASGRIVFSAEDAEAWVGRGEKVILVRAETSPEDIGGMHVSQGILTLRGGMTSHAAVVARGMGKPCISGAGALMIDPDAHTLSATGVVLKEGDTLTLDGSTGEIYVGPVPTVTPELTGDFATFMGWADEVRTMGVRANADTPRDAETAIRFGAEGIGLCRTEHMFFDPERILHVRAMILADSEADRRRELDKLLVYQRKDFVDLFTIMNGLPVTIRLLDPPLHEFLPEDEEDLKELARETGTDVPRVRARVRQLSEVNPMLGHRGCRLAITYPEIYEMQARAIFEAACEVSQAGVPVHPEIMVPLVSVKPELDILAELIHRVGAEVRTKTGVTVDYKIGTMIELPRAALRAGEIAETARFFSFGTNDLTQTAFGLSRDDAGNFIQAYRDRHVMKEDPFVTIDVEGVGELVEIAVERGLKTRPDLSLGICGEHAGDPATIRFCQKAGLSYVSCSPYRVPIARLAAAQAALDKK
jgi:pyruvate,orthophosphate dikinase